MFAGLGITPSAWAKDALVIWLHGLNLGFREPEYVQISRLVAARGVAFISAATRGHGFGSWLRGPAGTKLAGSAWEMLAEAPADITFWYTSVLQNDEIDEGIPSWLETAEGDCAVTAEGDVTVIFACPAANRLLLENLAGPRGE